jgi:transposase
MYPLSDGPHRRPMGSHQTVLPGSRSSIRWEGASTGGRSRCDEWDPLDFTNRSALAGSSRSISESPDLSSAIPGMVHGWNPGEDPAIIGQGSYATRRSGSPRNLHRWQLCSCQKRGGLVGKTKRGKGTKIMAIADRHGLPIAAGIASASPHEVTLVSETIENRFVPQMPEKLIGDRAYDSDGLDRTLSEKGIELIAPHRCNRRVKTQDGRALRRYVRRWRIERLFAWLFNFRRLVVRYERHAINYLGFLQLGCAMILLRNF